MAKQLGKVRVQRGADPGRERQKETSRKVPAEEFATTLREYLTTLGVSRNELARRAGISPSTLANYGSGRDAPPPAAVIAIEDALGIATGSLLSIFGFVRADGVFRPPSVADAINNDPRLTAEGKAALFGLYRVLVGDAH